MMLRLPISQFRNHAEELNMPSTSIVQLGRGTCWVAAAQWHCYHCRQTYMYSLRQTVSASPCSLLLRWRQLVAADKRGGYATELVCPSVCLSAVRWMSVKCSGRRWKTVTSIIIWMRNFTHEFKFNSCSSIVFYFGFGVCEMYVCVNYLFLLVRLIKCFPLLFYILLPTTFWNISPTVQRNRENWKSLFTIK